MAVQPIPSSVPPFLLPLQKQIPDEKQEPPLTYIYGPSSVILSSSLTLKSNHSNIILSNAHEIYLEAIPQTFKTARNRPLNRGGIADVYTVKNLAFREIVLENPAQEEMDAIREEIAFNEELSKNPLFPKCYGWAILSKPKELRSFMVLENGGKDLHRLYTDKQNRVKVTIAKVQKIFKKTLEAVAYLHSKEIIFGDLKLRNFLEDGKGEIKCIDFGASHRFKWKRKILYLSPLANRAPEEAFRKDLDSPPSPTLDVWALGCSIFRLMTKELLFPIPPSALQEGEQKAHEFLALDILKRLELKEPPAEWGLKGLKIHLPPLKSLKGKIQEFMRQNRASPNIKKIEEEFTDLMYKILEIDPCKRITAAQALKHPFFQIQLEKNKDLR